MSKIKRILKLLQQNISKRIISQRCEVSRNTVDKYEKILENHPLSINEIVKLSDKELYSIIAPPAMHEVTHDDLYDLFPKYEDELKKPGVTRLLLWEEYKEQYPQGVQYSQFCEHFKRYCKSLQLSYMHEHKAADKLMVDFAGKKLHIVDYETGELISVEFFVGILPCSGLTFARACKSQQSPDFLKSLSACIDYMGGVPAAIVTDNLKPAVNKASRYDPEINQSMADFAEHYNTCILPTRANKPKDKAMVEGAVNILYTRIYAPVRNITFHTLGELNITILELLEKHNHALFQKKDISRRDQFNAIEKDFLKPIPCDPYISRKYQKAKVHPNCHILLREDKHEYSVPYSFLNKEVEISYTSDLVEIYYKLERIATHPRDRRKYIPTTIESHLHPSHRYIKGWSPEFFKSKGQEIGEYASILIEKIFNQCKHPEQGFKLCSGVLQLAKKHGNEKMEKASHICIQYQLISYNRIKNILSNIEKLNFIDNEIEFPDIKHNNIRGDEYYQ
ncbi:MAG: IS21 family transposase [Ignavibacteria bacterium]